MKQNLKILTPFCKITDIWKVWSTFQSHWKLFVSIRNWNKTKKMFCLPRAFLLGAQHKIYTVWSSRLQGVMSLQKALNGVSLFWRGWQAVGPCCLPVVVTRRTEDKHSRALCIRIPSRACGDAVLSAFDVALSLLEFHPLLFLFHLAWTK